MTIEQNVWNQVEIVKEETKEFTWSSSACTTTSIRSALAALTASQMKFFEEMEELIEGELK